MTHVPRLYLDTNAFIFAVEEQSERSNLLMDLFSASEAADRAMLITSELTLAEVLVKPYRNLEDELISRYDAMIRDSAWLDVQPVEFRMPTPETTVGCVPYRSPIEACGLLDDSR